MFCFSRMFCYAVLASLLISACSIKQPASPEGFSVRSVARIENSAIFASDPQAGKVALEGKGLRLILTADGTEKLLSDRKPLALAWSSDGERLAAAFAADAQSRLVIYSAEGQEESSFVVAGRITHLDWNPTGTLYTFSLQLAHYSFGVNQRANLLTWSPGEALKNEPLFDTTLKERTVSELGDELYRLSRFDLSPLGDEIVYTRLADPPVISRSLKVTHRHLATGLGRWSFALPLESGGSTWSYDSEALLMSDGSKSYVWDPWQRKEVALWPLPGQHLACSPAEDMTYIDGVLFRDQQEIARLPSGPAAFSHDGEHLLISDRGKLYLYSLPTSQVADPIPPLARERLLLLRDLRSKDLLSLEEYLQTRNELLQ